MSEPYNHHVVPQFVLRNFAIDEDQHRVTSVFKDGDFAIWMERPIKGIGWEPDFYVHGVAEQSISVETEINRSIETPISQSETWAKVLEGRSDKLDASDRPVLYSLVRHLEARTPHYLQTGDELAEMAADPNSSIPFSDDEREMYAALRSDPVARKAFFNAMALQDFAQGHERSVIMVKRSRVRLRCSTTPVLTAPFDAVPGIDMPLPGMAPFQRLMAIDPHTLVSVVVGDFGGQIFNSELSDQEAKGWNRSVAAQFAYFPQVRHMISGADGLVADLAWASYDLLRDSPARKIFKRRRM